MNSSICKSAVLFLILFSINISNIRAEQGEFSFYSDNKLFGTCTYNINAKGEYSRRVNFRYSDAEFIFKARGIESHKWKEILLRTPETQFKVYRPSLNKVRIESRRSVQYRAIKRRTYIFDSFCPFPEKYTLKSLKQPLSKEYSVRYRFLSPDKSVKMQIRFLRDEYYIINSKEVKFHVFEETVMERKYLLWTAEDFTVHAMKDISNSMLFIKKEIENLRHQILCLTHSSPVYKSKEITPSKSIISRISLTNRTSPLSETLIIISEKEPDNLSSFFKSLNTRGYNGIFISSEDFIKEPDKVFSTIRKILKADKNIFYLIAEKSGAAKLLKLKSERDIKAALLINPGYETKVKHNFEVYRKIEENINKISTVQYPCFLFSDLKPHMIKSSLSLYRRISYSMQKKSFISFDSQTPTLQKIINQAVSIPVPQEQYSSLCFILRWMDNYKSDKYKYVNGIYIKRDKSWTKVSQNTGLKTFFLWSDRGSSGISEKIRDNSLKKRKYRKNDKISFISDNITDFSDLSTDIKMTVHTDYKGPLLSSVWRISVNNKKQLISASYIPGIKVKSKYVSRTFDFITINHNMRINDRLMVSLKIPESDKRARKRIRIYFSKDLPSFLTAEYRK